MYMHRIIPRFNPYKLFLWGMMCYNKHMRSKILLVLSGIALLGILVMLNYTSPKEAGVLGVLVFFTMIFILTFGMMVGLIKVFQRILDNKKNGRGRETNKTYQYATVAAFGPIMLLMIQAFSSINAFTVALVLIFEFLGCFLVHKRA